MCCVRGGTVFKRVVCYAVRRALLCAHIVYERLLSFCRR